MRLRILTAAALAALGLAACGGSSSGGGSSSTPAAGQSGAQVFMTAGCAGCHTLKAAHATGHVGPDLDQLKPSAALVEHQVTDGGGGMPSFKDSLSAAQIQAVAKYVSSSAGG